MAEISNKLRRRLDSKNPRLTVFLDDIFGKEVPDDSLREEIGQAVIDMISTRTENSNFLKTRGSSKKRKGPGSSAFRYTPEYINSFEFRVFGKSAGRVNLRASGDMLRSMDIVKSEPDVLVIGFEEADEASKAHGHITGSVGKQRDFFGLPESGVIKIRKEYKARVDEANRGIFAGDQRRPGEDNLEFLLRVLAASG